MAKTRPFDDHMDKYELWFVNNPFIFQSEFIAIQQLIPDNAVGVEIGVGTGIFASRLGIKYGVEPSVTMREKARERNINVNEGVAEQLPYPDESLIFYY